MKELLDLDTRRAIFEFLQEYPGMHLREISRRVGFDVRAVRYHLDFLEEHSAVTSLEQDGYLRYFPRTWDEGYFRERFGPLEKRVLGLLRQRGPLRIVLHLLDGGELSSEEIRERAEIAGSTLSYHVRKLSRIGLVEERTEQKRKMYRLADRQTVVQVLIHHRPPRDLIEDFIDLWEKVGL